MEPLGRNGPAASTTTGRRLVRLTVLLLLVLPAVVGWSAIRPANNRDWTVEQSRLAITRFDGDRIVIENVRNFDWSGAEAAPRWETRVYDLNDVESVSYVLTPFADDWRGPAHAFLSFGFAGGRRLAISVEARKEVGETYSIAKGMLKRFELMYVVGDERDLIGLRVLRWDDAVYVYPARATPGAARDLLVDMLNAANRLAGEPAFYGSLRDNCTTRILRHVNRIAPERIRWSWRILLPGYSDELAHARGLLDTDLSLEAARERFHVNDRVRASIDAADFSTAIRRAP